METTAKRKVDPKAYGAFIEQIELEDLWLQSAAIENRYGPNMPEPGRVSIDHRDSRWEPTDKGFRAFLGYQINILDDDQIYASVAITYGLEFASADPMSDEYFKVFSDRNLPINTWPFLREFFYTTLGRMGWVSLTLPTLKVGIPTQTVAAQEEQAPPKRSRKKSAKSTA